MTFNSPHSIISTLWLVWLTGWLLASFAASKAVVRQSPGSRLAHAVFIWTGAMLVFMKPRPSPFLTSFVSDLSWIPWPAVVMVAAGLGFATWARVYLGRLWSGDVTLKAHHTIVRTGPYALSRHPIYSGLMLAVVGSACVQGTVAAVAGVILVWAGIILKIRQEEHLLGEHFGPAYRAYRAEVPMLVPRMSRAIDRSRAAL